MKYGLEGKNLLVIDPSSEHLGFSIVECRGSEAIVKKAGMLYATSSWDLGHKLYYMENSIDYMVKKFKINVIVTEMFEMPKFRQMGVSVIPTINNNLKKLAYEHKVKYDSEIEVVEWPVPSWRAEIGISAGIPALDKKGQLMLTKSGRTKKDYKIPAKNKVEEILKVKIPDKLLNNSDLKLRKVPYDLTDCLAISIAYTLKFKYPKIRADKDYLENEEMFKLLYSMRKTI